jgi:hypothetical protein
MERMMADAEPNQPPDPNPTQNTMHTSSDGIAGQVLLPLTTVNAYRAGEFAAGGVPTLEIGDAETWPPEEPE